MEDYIRQRQNTFAQYIAMQLLLDLCEAMERTPGMRVGMWWWDQSGIYLTGTREMTSAEAEAYNDGMED